MYKICNVTRSNKCIVCKLLPPGYDIRHVDRERRGGRVALINKKDISF